MTKLVVAPESNIREHAFEPPLLVFETTFLGLVVIVIARGNVACRKKSRRRGKSPTLNNCSTYKYDTGVDASLQEFASLFRISLLLQHSNDRRVTIGIPLDV